jgi:Predicted membrane protein (DUF2306)
MPLLKNLLLAAVALLGLRVFLGILSEYPKYLPPDFDSAFLTGREESFTRFYATAFYLHLVSGPLTIVLGTFLVWSRGRGPWRTWHRWAGRVQMFLIFVLLVPTGLIMARNAFAGPIAGVGFAALSFATGATAAAALYYAINKRIAQHERWATRCFILLASPLLLRVIAGAAIVTQYESLTTYQLNAWLSWLVPLLGYEVWLRWPAKSAERAVKMVN